MSRECKECGNEVVLMAFGRKDNYYYTKEGGLYNSRDEYLEDVMEDVLYGWEYRCRGCGAKSSKASNICK